MNSALQSFLIPPPLPGHTGHLNLQVWSDDFYLKLKDVKKKSFIFASNCNAEML